MTNELGERRDLVEERDSIEYQAMLATVYDEMVPECEPWLPSWRDVHEEAMKRLRDKYESACAE